MQVFGCRPLHDYAHAVAAGVRKAPRHEIAVGWAPGGATVAMGIWPRRGLREGSIDAVAAVAWRQNIGAGGGVNAAEHGSTGCATGLAVRRWANLAGWRKR